MSKKDASFHISQAGAAAMKKAEAAGSPPEAMEAIIDSEPLEIAGLVLQPLSLPVVWALQSVGAAILQDEAGHVEMGPREMAVCIACFADAKGMNRLAKCGDQATIDDRVMDIVEKVDFQKMATINAWMNLQYARVRKLNGADLADADAPEAGPKKPERPRAAPSP
jgi:hypothetical protein